MTTTCIVLAGGASTRFGADKLLVPLDGRPLLHHALLASAGVADRLVLVLAPRGPVPRIPADLRIPLVVVRDREAGGGPLVGLLAGLDATPDDHLALVVAGDMPSLHASVLALLLDQLRGDPDVAAVTLAGESPAPLPAALRPGPARAAASDALTAGRRSLLACLDRLPRAEIAPGIWRAIDPAGATLRDVDVRGDLA
jgi:molybdopterin-guanine dinucleotide biosynthesis protein A